MEYLIVTTSEGIEFKFVIAEDCLWLSMHDILEIQPKAMAGISRSLNRVLSDFGGKSDQHLRYFDMTSANGKVNSIKHYSIHVAMFSVARSSGELSYLAKVFWDFYIKVFLTGMQHREDISKYKLHKAKIIEPRKLYRTPHNIRKRELPNEFTDDDWQRCLEWFDYQCAVCERNLSNPNGQFQAAKDHWIPVSYKGEDNLGTVPENIIPLCRGKGSCNNSKGSLMPEIWLSKHYSPEEAQAILNRIEAYFEWVITNT